MTPHPKLVQCVCPSKHCISGLTLRNDIADEHAINAMRQEMQKVLAHCTHARCSKCGATPETWTCEVVAVSEDWSQMLAELEMLARHHRARQYVQIDGQFYERPRGEVARN